MKYNKILITGGAGFVGSNLAIKIKNDFQSAEVVALDNLKRRGSELTVPKLKENSVEFVHGDIRNKEDLEIDKIDLLIECSAEPSVMAGIDSSPDYLINTNLVGTINCLELARKNSSDVMFLSTSRVYPIEYINSLKYTETQSRFELLEKQSIIGSSSAGISEDFPLNKARSLYGATKLASELMLTEYIDTYNMKGIINRCGVITGPWQMGKIDQGVFVLWVAKHYFKNDLSYIGYGGTGKQVRDFIHIDDLYNSVKHQIENFDVYSNDVWNIGGGRSNSVSLLELTKLCEQVTSNKINISSVIEDRPADVRIFITDSAKFLEKSGVMFEKDALMTVKDIYQWIQQNEKQLKPILA